jgi:hypothetical protein
MKGEVIGISFVIGYVRHWPNATQEIPIKCYLTSQERTEKASWLKAGEWALVHGEVTDRGSMYVLQLEHLSKPERVPGEDNEYLTGM